MIAKSSTNEKNIPMNFLVPEAFYKIYKKSSEESGKTMKTILIESFYLWVEKNGIGKWNFKES